MFFFYCNFYFIVCTNNIKSEHFNVLIKCQKELNTQTSGRHIQLKKISYYKIMISSTILITKSDIMIISNVIRLECSFNRAFCGCANVIYSALFKNRTIYY